MDKENQTLPDVWEKAGVVMPSQQQKSPQVLADLTGGIQILSDTSISQDELVAMLCDGDLSKTNYAVSTLRRFIRVHDLVEE